MPWTTSAAPSRTRPGAPATSSSPTAQGRPVRALEQAREPDRPPAGQARLHPEAQRPDLPRLPAQGAAPRDLPRRQHRERAHTARRVAEVGPTIPTAAVRQTRQTHHRTALKSRGGASAQLVERSGRTSQHPDPADRPTRLGYRSPAAVIALAMLSLGGLCPPSQAGEQPTDTSVDSEKHRLARRGAACHQTPRRTARTRSSSKELSPLNTKPSGTPRSQQRTPR